MKKSGLSDNVLSGLNFIISNVMTENQMLPSNAWGFGHERPWTKEEREKIIAESLGCGSDCSMCCACGGMEIDYQQYIDGKKEIAQLNAEYRANTMIGH